MQSKSLIMLIVALGCGVVAAMGITQVMANRSGGSTVEAVETESVYVALADIELGKALTAEVLKLEEWPKDKIPAGALSKFEDVDGRRPKTKLFAGEPILDAKLLAKGESDSAARQIPLGYRSVPVRVDEVSGGAAMIQPGDRVDVLVYVKRGSDITATRTKTILQDIRIFAVDAKWSLEEDESGQALRAKTISLLLTPEQTERVMMAHELGKIRLSLRSPEDDKEVELPEGGHKIAELLGDVEAGDRERDSTLMEELVAPPVVAMAPVAETAEPEVMRPSHTVRVIHGSEVQQIMMQGPPAEQALFGDEEQPTSAASLFWQIMAAPGAEPAEKDSGEPESEPGKSEQPEAENQEEEASVDEIVFPQPDDA